MFDDAIAKSLKIDHFFYTPPTFHSKLYVTNKKDDLMELASRFKIDVAGNGLNYIYIDDDFINTAKINFAFRGQNNVIIIGKPITQAFLKLSAEFKGDDCTLIISDLSHLPVRLSIIFYNSHQLIVWGKETTSNGTAITAQFDNSVIAVGDDCMFATNTCMRNSDMHGIYDLSTMKKINKYGNMILQPHVWIGQDSFLLGNMLIRYGSIVGVQSLVKGEVEPCCLFAGTPAKKIKSNVSWNRGSSEELPKNVIDLLGLCKNKLG